MRWKEWIDGRRRRYLLLEDDPPYHFSAFGASRSIRDIADRRADAGAGEEPARKPTPQ